MPDSDVEVVVVGGGAAGIAAARRLQQAAVRCLLVEARGRLGGRAWTITDESGFALDLGCGWLHSADRNPWLKVAEEGGFTIDKTPPPWTGPPPAIGFSRAEQEDYRKALDTFFVRVAQFGGQDGDRAAASLLEPNGRWNGLINAIGTYMSGTDLDRLSVKDLHRYAETGVNYRVVEGYGTLIGRYGADVPVMRDCTVTAVDHSGRRLRIETSRGAIAADRVIIAVPSAVLAAERLRFTPELPAKIDAARGLPLGLADKLFIALDRAEEFDKESRLFGRTDRSGTGAYHLRPFGRPQIEAYFAGGLARALEAQGEAGFFDYAVSELTGLFGSDFARRLRPIRMHLWGRDPFALGSYSFALPGRADDRQALAAPIDDRLFFAGEACSLHDFSTAHGGWHTGVAAAEQVIAARGR